MPRRPEQFEQIKDERRASILKHALPLFALRPAKDISIDLIAQAAKCSHGHVYHYFKNTEQILLEFKSSETYKDILLELTSFDSKVDTYSQITNIVKSFLSIAGENKNIIAYTLVIISDESKQSFYAHFLKLIEKGQNERVVTGGNPKDIEDCFVLLIKGLYQSILNQKHPNVRVPSIDNVLNIFKRR